MNTNQAKQLKIGDTIFFEYTKGVIESKLRDTNCMDVQIGSFIHGANSEEIFFPTDHVKEVAQIVTEERKKFDEKKCFGANINPGIYGLFTIYWINMCNTEDSPKAYEQEKNEFYKFIDELNKVVEATNTIAIGGIPYLRR